MDTSDNPDKTLSEGDKSKSLLESSTKCSTKSSVDSSAPTRSLPTPLIGRDEMNLAEFALGLLSDRNPKGLKTIERVQFVPQRDGRVLEQRWIVTGSDKYGLPRAGDDDVLLGLLKLASDQQFSSQKVYFSRYELISLLNWPMNGSSYERLQEALDRLAGVRIVAKNSFWDNEQKRYISLNFGIIDEYQLYESRATPRRTEQLAIPLTYVRLSDKLFTSIHAKNIKRLDLDFYNALTSSVAKRLYRFLSKRQRMRQVFEIELLSLASVNVGLDLSKRRYVSQIKQNLDKGHRELVERGFLRAWEYRWAEARDQWFVVYTFAEMLAAEGEEPPMFEVLDAGMGVPALAELDLVTELMNRGFSTRVAQRLVAGYRDRIAAKLELYDQLRAARSHLLKRNPLGWLRRAIEEDYQAPQRHAREPQRPAGASSLGKSEQRQRQDQEQQPELLAWYRALDGGEQAVLLEAARARLEFLPQARREKLDLRSPMLRGMLYEVIEERRTEKEPL